MTVADFKVYFDRGQFDFGQTYPHVRDSDITKAIAEAEALFNMDLYPDTATQQMALGYLIAHFLASDTMAADGGGEGSFLVTSKSAGGVSVGIHIPDWMQKGDFAFFATTYYGQKYLTLSRPYLGGVVLSVPGGTNP